MQQYLDLLRDCLDNGDDRATRGTLADGSQPGSRSVFGRQVRYDLRRGFPLVTTKRVLFRHIVAELFWFLSGSTSVRPLQAQGVRIWDQWADANGDLGPIYSKQWRSWETNTCDTCGTLASNHADGVCSFTPRTVDQIAGTIARIRANPNDRRLVVSAWNVADLPAMRLPPCHCLFQFYVANGRLSCQLYQRSADLLLGVPYNIASYALLTHLIAHVTGLAVGEFIHTVGDAHIYTHHFDAVREQLTRGPRPSPRLLVRGHDHAVCCPSLSPPPGYDKWDGPGIDDLVADDVRLEGYNPHPPIKAEVAV